MKPRPRKIKVQVNAMTKEEIAIMIWECAKGDPRLAQLRQGGNHWRLADQMVKRVVVTKKES